LCLLPGIRCWIWFLISSWPGFGCGFACFMNHSLLLWEQYLQDNHLLFYCGVVRWLHICGTVQVFHKMLNLVLD
jgi:hypothetical protein